MMKGKNTKTLTCQNPLVACDSQPLSCHDKKGQKVQQSQGFQFAK